jgi:Protein of unknown function (DUF3293)
MRQFDLRNSYKSARLRADGPEGGWPESFGLVTAWNPDGKKIPEEENAARTETLREDLESRGLPHFPVTGYDLESDHYEEGFGIVCDKAETLRLGREWNQLAVFWVEAGWVWLIFCEPDGEECKLRSLEEMLGR